tara:strand:+ start:2096 stop:2539 length:444 start_codon:yes stop_codon:yes gene_type:complete
MSSILQKNHTDISGTSVSLSKRQRRFFNLAKNIAHDSSYDKLRHGAVLVKGGSVISAACNKDNFSSFGSRFRDPDAGHGTHHAELGCVLGISRDVTSGSDIYVCRVNKQNEFRLSKPCRMCHDIMKHVGIKRVYYTTDDGSVKMYKL